MTETKLLIAMMDHAINISKDCESMHFDGQLDGLDEKIRMIETQIENQPETLTDIQDDHQYQIHSLEFEKTTVDKLLEKNSQALTTTKAALEQETRRRVALEDRLGELEDRLLGALRM